MAVVASYRVVLATIFVWIEVSSHNSSSFIRTRWDECDVPTVNDRQHTAHTRDVLTYRHQERTEIFPQIFFRRMLYAVPSLRAQFGVNIFDYFVCVCILSAQDMDPSHRRTEFKFKHKTQNILSISFVPISYYQYNRQRVF